MEAVPKRCSVKKVFLEILQNSQENTCGRVSFLNKVAGEVFSCEFWCFPVNSAKFLRTPFLTEHLWWLLLYKCDYFKQLQEHVLFYSTTTIRDFRYKLLHIPTYLGISCRSTASKSHICPHHLFTDRLVLFPVWNRQSENRC